MAHEIEIKAKLKNKKEIIAKLKSLGCKFEKPITQDDAVYVEHTGPVKTFLSNKVFLRLRVVNEKKVLFTAKNRTAHLVAIERELEISSRDEMEQALFLMGYKQAVRIIKTRIITHYKGCEICIDEVKNLGSFIEMEQLTDNEQINPQEIQEKLFSFFESIEIKKSDRVQFGYDILMLQKNEKRK